MRRRLEATLGLPIWTAKSEFQSQQAIAAWLGFDPWVLNLKVVRTLASQQGILIGGMNPSKALVLARLQDAFEASHHAKASPKTPSPPVTGGADR